MIRKCKNCETKKIHHKFQDEKYGEYNRVCNPTPVKLSESEFVTRCTVCAETNSTKK